MTGFVSPATTMQPVYSETCCIHCPHAADLKLRARLQEGALMCVRVCVCVNIFEMVRKQAKQMQGYLLQRFCSDQLGRDGTYRSKTDWLHMQFYGPEMTHGRLQRQSVPRSAVHRDGVQEVA